MREYAKVSPQFWTGRTGKALRAAGPEAVIVALYLMTSPHANMIGLYYCPMVYIAHDTGLGFEGASKGLRSAIEAGFCTFEEEIDYVFVHEFAAYQIGDELSAKDLRVKGVTNELAKVPKGQCHQAFTDRYGAAFCLPIEPENTRPTEAPSKPLRSQEQEQEKEQEQEQEKELLAAKAGREATPPVAVAPATTRGSRLPGDWALPKAWGDWAMTEMSGWTADVVRLEAAKFADYWHSKTGKDATKADWLATWRNWCRAARPIPVARGAPSASLTAQRNAEAARLLGFHSDDVIEGSYAAQ
jgi:hypothetical protein